jgi:succinate dehydrogenase / fumarate reductase, cytochrome b subunit
VAIRVRKSTDDYGSIYKGHEGQWSWMLHRITGVAVIFFLFAHVVDTSLVGWGPEAYNRVTAAYENPIIRLLELGLVAAVLYHGINGLKITLIDFFPRLVTNITTVSFIFTGIFLAIMIPVTWVMLQQTWDLYRLEEVVVGG